MSTSRPEKPYPDFPLTPHPNGSWCKRIRGRLFYFGRWDNWQEALEEYLDQRDDLHAGRTPKRRKNAQTLGYALDHSSRPRSWLRSLAKFRCGCIGSTSGPATAV